MNEITDRKLSEIEHIILGISISQDPGVQWRLYKAWEHSSNHEDGTGEWYQVVLIDQVMRSLGGILDAERRLLYLDLNSTLALVEERITAHLDAFNAGHHWRYKGL